MSKDKVADAINAKLSGSALSGLVIGVVALLLSAVPIINNFAAILAVAGLILGVVGIRATKKSKRRGKGMAVTATIISALALVIVFASQAMYGAALDEVGKGLDKASGNATADILGKEVDVTVGAFSAVEGEYGLMTTLLPVKVTNKLDESKSYTVKVEAVDASGTRILDDTVYADSLGAKQSQNLEAFKYVESTKVEALKTATFKVVSVSQM